MEDYILTTCKECGNKGLLKKAATYDQHLLDYADGEPVATLEYTWILLECPVCKSVSLYRKYGSDHMVDYNGDEYYEETIVYP